MPSKHTFSILPIIRINKINSKGEVPIYIRITIDGKPVEISSKHFIDSTQWISQKGRVKGNNEKARTINQTLENIEWQAKQAYNSLREKGRQISARMVKDTMLGVEEKKHSLVSVFEYHNKQMKSQIGKEFAAGTLERYETTLRLVKLFMKYQYNLDDIYLFDLKYEFIADFEYFLKTIRNCNHNTSMKYIMNLRKIINISVVNEWLDRDPFMKMKVSIKEVKRDYLTQDELQLVEEKQFSTPRLNQVKDIFVFCCYTGLAYADVEKLSPQEVNKGLDGEYWLFTERRKTGSSSNIPLLPQALTLIDKYKQHPEAINKGKLFPVITNQKMNAYLKEIADVCGISKTLTFHIARHTFATTVTLTNGVPIESVSAMLGHKNMRTTQIYAKVVQKKVSDDMKRLKERLNPIIETEIILKKAE
jgi:site-specific recombinase XerD